jgi:hypothetical protein
MGDDMWCRFCQVNAWSHKTVLCRGDICGTLKIKVPEVTVMSDMAAISGVLDFRNQHMKTNGVLWFYLG